MAASLLSPIHSSMPFGSTVPYQRRGFMTEHQQQLQGRDSFALASCRVSAPPHNVARLLSLRCGASPFEVIAHGIRSLRGALHNPDLPLAPVLREVDDTLQSCLAELHEDEEDDVVKESRAWLRATKQYLSWLQRDVVSARNAMVAGAPMAEHEWHQTLSTAIHKLMAAMSTSGIEIDMRADGCTTTSNQGCGESLESSCSSSICDSAEHSGMSSAGTSSKASGHRLVATRSRLHYAQHWAGKVAL